MLYFLVLVFFCSVAILGILSVIWLGLLAFNEILSAYETVKNRLK